MGKFIVSQRRNGEYQFNLFADNGQVILTSEGYSSKSNCLNGVASVIKNSADIDKFDRRTSANGKHYFNLKATNGQIIGTSQMYESLASRENGIYSVQINASRSDLIDQG